MPKQEKIDMVAEIKEDVEASSGYFLTDYRGLKVSEITDLRRKLRTAGAEYKVVKNTLFGLAVGEEASGVLAEHLAGPTAIAFVKTDPVASAKALVDFVREHKNMSLKAGMVEGQFLGMDQVQALSKIPPREVLVAQMLGSMQSPITGFVGTLQGLMSNLVYTLQAVTDQKSA
ncbi:MAG: 50S ribosomal protein L10 [Armatimonadota bacterium]